LFVPDADEGIHILKEKRDPSHLTSVHSDYEEMNINLGQVQNIAMNPDGSMLAVYANALSSGQILVLDDTMEDCKNTLATFCLNADDLNWCGNDSIVLTSGKSLVIVGP